MSFIFTDRNYITAIKGKIEKEQGIWATIKNELNDKADAAMLKGPWSVTFDPSPAISGNIHDYYSEGTYWWPNPDNPEGPFIRRDGEVYPQQFNKHKQSMRDMIEAFSILCYGGYFLNERKYLERAAQLIKVWFLDEATLMNPHLEYGQAIRGICEGRGIGIIDLHYLLKLIHGLCFLDEYPHWQNELNEMRKWFSNLTIWMTNSKKGIDEKNNGNNHATWWAVQVASYAAFTKNDALVNEIFSFFKEVIIPGQMYIDGSFPDELKRTKSYTYSLFNLNACTCLCEIAYQKGIDLWNYKTLEGKSMELAIKYMYPYIKNPALWKLPQIDGYFPKESFAFQLASVRFKNMDYTVLNERIISSKSFLEDEGTLGPLVFFPGGAIE